MTEITNTDPTEQLIHWWFHEIEAKVGVDADKIAEIISLWEDAKDAKGINDRVA